MSTETAIEELLTETLKRAGEIAVPEDILVPLYRTGQDVRIAGGMPDRAGSRSTRSWWISATGIAALVLVGVGLALLLRSSPTFRVGRTQLSAAQGERLLCGSPGCVPVFHAAAGQSGRVSAGTASPPTGNFQTLPARAPLGTWIVADSGRFERLIDWASGNSSVTNGKSGVIYVSAGGGRYYRYVLPGGGPAHVVSHTAHTVTLSSGHGHGYVLDLNTSQITATQ